MGLFRGRLHGWLAGGVDGTKVMGRHGEALWSRCFFFVVVEKGERCGAVWEGATLESFQSPVKMGFVVFMLHVETHV